MTARMRTHHADAETIAYMTDLEDRAVQMENALRELYDACHGYLNLRGRNGRMAAGTPRLNAALGEAFKALHPPERS